MIGFKYNDYDSYVVNIIIEKQQHSLHFHAGAMLSSHTDPEINTDFGQWENKTYGKIKPIEICGGDVQEFIRPWISPRRANVTS